MSSRYVLTPDGRKRVTVIPGDGIGPEVVAATRRIIDATGVRIAWEEHAAGASVFKQGIATGVPEATIRSIQETRVALKGPLETPVGYGEKSANVTLRKLFETYGNLRPVRELPGVKTPFSGRGIDLIVVRENVEDLYAGIEHMQTPGVAQCLKLISRKGCEKIVRLAFEVARAEGRKTVHCATKANIMKLTEGLMKRTFEEVAKEYPEIEAHHIIIDNCCHQLVRTPEQFDVIVTSNMNGDIMSDLTSGLIGGLGFAPGANIGSDVAIFEAVHGSAPKYAGKGVINPTAVLLSSLMMLRHLEEFDAAERIEHALLVTLAEGSYTRDVKVEGSLGTTAFADRIIANLGRKAEGWTVRRHQALHLPQVTERPDAVKATSRRLAGADIFLESAEASEELGQALVQAAEGTHFKLKMISNRGTRVFPHPGNLPDCVDHWRCRFVVRPEAAGATDGDLLALVQRVSEGRRWMHLEKLEELDGQPGWTKAQGED
jgi:isocitrate dehydrogenase